METQDFQKQLKDKTGEAEGIIKRVFAEYLEQFRSTPYIQTITEAMDYSFLAGGKRLRPLMMRETFALFQDLSGADELQIMALEHFMTALEMIHTYSLVHDDLPAMDNDEYRRGKKTTWKVYGDGMGVLAGDALLNSAYETGYGVTGRLLRQNASMELIKRAACAGEILSGKAGIEGMLGGQVADVEAEEKQLELSLEHILFIHKRKTAALIECAMGIGALLAGADEEQLQTVYSIAENVGIAFQIQDDILDVTGDSKELGKQVGSDAANGKQTYVNLKGLEQAAADVERLSREAVEMLKTLPGDHSFLEALILYLVYRRK